MMKRYRLEKEYESMTKTEKRKGKTISESEFNVTPILMKPSIHGCMK